MWSLRVKNDLIAPNQKALYGLNSKKPPPNLTSAAHIEFWNLRAGLSPFSLSPSEGMTVTNLLVEKDYYTTPFEGGSFFFSPTKDFFSYRFPPTKAVRASTSCWCFLAAPSWSTWGTKTPNKQKLINPDESNKLWKIIPASTGFCCPSFFSR